MLAGEASRLAARVGAPIEVRRVLVRDTAKQRVAACDPALVTSDPGGSVAATQQLSLETHSLLAGFQLPLLLVLTLCTLATALDFVNTG